MSRQKTDSFILELPLVVSPSDEKELLSRFESGRQLYNAALGEAVRRVKLIKESKLRKIALSMKKNNPERKKIFAHLNKFYKFTDYEVQAYLTKTRPKLVSKLDCHTVQKLATRAFQATQKLLFGTAKKIRFKAYSQMKSLESKSNVAGILWRNNVTEWNGLRLIPIIKKNDEVICYSLTKRVKYCRIVKKLIKGRYRFYVQLALEGKAYVKPKNKMGKGIVCFDLGPSTVAVVSKNDNDEFQGKLTEFCTELDLKQKRIKAYQRRIDRQKRSNNPNNYNDDRSIKKGKHEWKKSKRQVSNESKLVEIHRVVAENRRSLQGKLANETIRMGNIFKTEDISGKWFQKLYGKSVGAKAPKTYVALVKRKAESAGGSFMQFSTRQTGLSQNCICGKRHKKKLSEREHVCDCGVVAQRDLFSGYLGIFVEEIEKVKKEDNEKYILQTSEAARLWTSADKLLQTVWMNSVKNAKLIKSATGRQMPSSFGNPEKVLQRQSRSFEEEGRVKFKVWDVVADNAMQSYGESPKENEIFPLEPTGLKSRQGVSVPTFKT